MKNEKKQYLAPEFTLVAFTGDLLTTSGGHDETDNWYNDVFAN